MILFKITLYLIVVFVVFNLLTKNYVNKYKLCMIFGRKGAGKSTKLTQIAIKAYRDGKKVYCNTPIPTTEYFDVNQIGFREFEPDSIILIDEVSLIWDNRQWKSLKPEVIKFFRYQRHKKLTIYMFSQSFDVDKKLRDLCDELYLMRNFMRVFSLCRKINKRVTVSQPKEDEEGNTGQGCLVEDYSFAPIFSPSAFKLMFIPRWTVFFDSFEDTPQQAVDSEFVTMNGEQYTCISRKGYLKYVVKKVITKIRGTVSGLFTKRKKQ